ncbi:MAG: cytochrome c biogenesis protein CcdA [Planctomycetota bacterium]
MEFSIFPKHEDLLKKFVEIRLHTDHENEELEKKAAQLQKKMAGTKALPVYILVDPAQPDVVVSKIEGADPPGSTRFADWLKSGGKLTEETSDGLWALLASCILGGLFALIMPCTYPMIPITIAFFTKQAEAREGRILPLALCYGLGIILCFIIVGVAIGGVIISIAQGAVLNIIFGVVFLVFALSFFDLFTIRLPASVNNLASKASDGSGLAGVFLLGATLVITSFTCTAPVVGTLLAGLGMADQEERNAESPDK